mmetsp:Transcript_11377/g.25946  ORF Transcript_11377/g.25946 Transcript_11377/m.25946 type:complete len:117 (-) Transcript_11377:3134-3484(-)|eukprot:764529-Hanusia_phi.AAC.5
MGQASQKVRFSEETFPTGQDVQALCRFPEIFPYSHGLQDNSPLSPYVPAGHSCKQEEFEDLPGESVPKPGGQDEQDEAPDVLANESAPQGEQESDCVVLANLPGSQGKQVPLSARP